MKVYVALDQYENLLVSRKPFKMSPKGDIDARDTRDIYLPTQTLKANEGALIDLRLTPRKGYTRTTFDGCRSGVMAFFGKEKTERMAQTEPNNDLWVVYTKTLKREMAPKVISG